MMSEEEAMVDKVYADDRQEGGGGGKGQTWTSGVGDVVKLEGALEARRVISFAVDPNTVNQTRLW